MDTLQVLFFCSLSEAQKGAEDKGQIKAQLGWMPVRVLLPSFKEGPKEGQERIWLDI